MICIACDSGEAALRVGERMACDLRGSDYYANILRAFATSLTIHPTGAAFTTEKFERPCTQPSLNVQQNSYKHFSCIQKYLESEGAVKYLVKHRRHVLLP